MTERPPASRRIGLIGLGQMGAPIASRLLAAGHELTVWNRSPAAADFAGTLGARVERSVAELFMSSDAILLVLANAEAADRVLGHESSGLAVTVKDRLVIQLGTTLPMHSQLLAKAIADNGGRYVEAPVSGSRVPAEQGRLIAMLGASCERDFAEAESILSCLTAKTVRVGRPPRAMQMKLAVNALLVPLVTALSEAWRLAEALDLDLETFARILNHGPMASDVSRMKIGKLLAQDWTAQASIRDVLMNAQLIMEVAGTAGTRTHLVAACEVLLKRAQEAGLGALDMVAVTATSTNHSKNC